MDKDFNLDKKVPDMVCCFSEFFYTAAAFMLTSDLCDD